MAPLTRVAAKAPEAPGFQGSPELGALPQQGVPDPGQLVTLQHEAEVSRLHAIIAESNAQRNVSDAAAAEASAIEVGVVKEEKIWERDGVAASYKYFSLRWSEVRTQHGTRITHF
ncbi:hypothetical protein E4U56_007781 [Claviceps arundinis]|uniref:Uncharacterized protein n=1 Tax=Claviceps arundinis TaxID=1623583 RepID=A0A9P7SUM0_9HYPO|nr:hypothetical protein E4U56_007781 [Claviceps arundinis]